MGYEYEAFYDEAHKAGFHLQSNKQSLGETSECNLIGLFLGSDHFTGSDPNIS